MTLDPFEAEKCLADMVFIADTREQDTDGLRRRLSYLTPYEREFVDHGDYTAKTLLPDGSWFYLPVCVERKMNCDEIIGNLIRERDRFTAEFERAKEAGTKMYIVVEGASWLKFYNKVYRSLAHEKSVIASLCTWMARYNCPILFCDMYISGKLIRDILHYEMREALDRMVDYG